MKVITMPEELLNRLRWDEACEILGIGQWAVAEGQMDLHEEITLTEEQAARLGLAPVQTEQSPQRTCTHCGRDLGDNESGWASIRSHPVCHPNVPDRPDCYRLVTVYGEDLGSRR